MGRAKRKATPAADVVDLPVTYRLVPYFAAEVDDPRLTGIRGVGDTPKKALASMRGAIRSRYPAGKFRLVEKIENPDFIEGWKMPEPFGE